jgi:acetyl esterase
VTFEMEPAVAEAVRKAESIYPRPPGTMSPAEIKAAAGPVPPADPKARPAGISVKDEALSPAGLGRKVATRRYRPAQAGEVTVIYLHGGGFTTGGLDSHDAVCAALANETQSEVVAVDYSKLPERPFPAAYEDAVGVVRTLGAGGRPLALAGDSSGANLALAAALAVRKEPVALRALLLYYPVIGLDFETKSYVDNAVAPLLTTARCRRIWSDYLSGDVDGVRTRRDWRAAPLLADDFAGLPHTTIAVAEYDPLLSEGLDLAQRLEAAGVPSTVIHGDRLPHGFVRWGAISGQAATAIGRATETFRRQLNQNLKRASA